MTDTTLSMPLPRFRPRLWSTLLMLCLVAVFVMLGQWQWEKAERKSTAQALLDARAVEAPVSLPATVIAEPSLFHYRRVSARGRYREAGQILIDNQLRAGPGEEVGYRVLTPFVIDDSEVEVLVDRGWLAAPGDRSRLPPIGAVPPAPTLLVGTAVVPSGKHFALAADTAPPGGNARWQYPDLARYARESRTRLQPVLVRLDADQPGGFLREWPRPDERHERHRSYALQWFGFAFSAVAIWAWFGARRAS